MARFGPVRFVRYCPKADIHGKSHEISQQGACLLKSLGPIFPRKLETRSKNIETPPNGLIQVKTRKKMPDSLSDAGFWPDGSGRCAWFLGFLRQQPLSA
jgi:hypothetical protein